MAQSALRCSLFDTVFSASSGSFLTPEPGEAGAAFCTTSGFRTVCAPSTFFAPLTSGVCILGSSLRWRGAVAKTRTYGERGERERRGSVGGQRCGALVCDAWKEWQRGAEQALRMSCRVSIGGGSQWRRCAIPGGAQLTEK